MIYVLLLIIAVLAYICSLLGEIVIELRLIRNSTSNSFDMYRRK